MVDKAWLLKIEERGEELKVPYHASTAVVRDGNLPYIMANCLYFQQKAKTKNREKSNKDYLKRLRINL